MPDFFSRPGTGLVEMFREGHVDFQVFGQFDGNQRLRPVENHPFSTPFLEKFLLLGAQNKHLPPNAARCNPTCWAPLLGGVPFFGALTCLSLSVGGTRGATSSSGRTVANSSVSP